MALYLVRVMNDNVSSHCFDNVLVSGDCLEQVQDFADYTFSRSRVACVEYIDFSVTLPSGEIFES